ncbi:MAG: right-handed parallel beta-helix repeat-containing protein, partial [Planctomycetota bacterium]
RGGPMVIKNNIIENNQEGGIVCKGLDVEIIENIIRNNSTHFVGGGIYFIDCGNTSKISMNILTHNEANLGGGIRCAYCSPLISENVFFENTASQGGGGIVLRSSDALIVNNVFNGNCAGSGGAILCEETSAPKIVNNTLYGNNATYLGGALYFNYYSNAVIMNSILWGNSARSGKEIFIGNAGVSAVSIDYSNVERGEKSVFVKPGGSVLAWGDNMIDEDPGFVDRANNDFHLLYTSSCVGAGLESYTYSPGKDMEGDPRGSGHGSVEIGADEFYGRLYFTGEATPGGEIKARIVGGPGSQAYALLIGTEVLDPPLPTKYGALYLKTPYTTVGPLGAFPADGVLTLKARIPQSPVAPYDLPMQVLMDSTYLFHSLTNLAVLKIR